MIHRSHHPHSRWGERGVATLVVLMFLFLMMAFIWTNSAALSRLKSDLRLVEQRQLKKYQAPGATNAAPLRARPPAVQPMAP